MTMDKINVDVKVGKNVSEIRLETELDKELNLYEELEAKERKKVIEDYNLFNKLSKSQQQKQPYNIFNMVESQEELETLLKSSKINLISELALFQNSMLVSNNNLLETLKAFYGFKGKSEEAISIKTDKEESNIQFLVKKGEEILLEHVYNTPDNRPLPCKINAILMTELIFVTKKLMNIS